MKNMEKLFFNAKAPLYEVSERDNARNLTRVIDFLANEGKNRLWQDTRIPQGIVNMACYAIHTHDDEHHLELMSWVLGMAEDYNRLTQMRKADAVRNLRARQRPVEGQP